MSAMPVAIMCPQSFPGSERRWAGTEPLESASRPGNLFLNLAESLPAMRRRYIFLLYRAGQICSFPVENAACSVREVEGDAFLDLVAAVGAFDLGRDGIVPTGILSKEIG